MEKIISATILLLILLPLCISLLLSMPRIQNMVVDAVSAIVEERSGAKIEIGRIDMGIFGKLILEDVVIYDLQQRPMMSFSHFDSHISAIELIGARRVRLSYGSLKRAELNIREVEGGKTNIQQMVQLATGGRKGQGIFHLIISNATIENMDVNIERNEHRNPSYGMDYGDMGFNIARCRVGEFNLDGPAIYAQIESLQASERSGFELSDMSGSLYVMGGVISLEQLKLATPKSSMELDYLRLVGDSWHDYRDFIGQVEIAAELRGSRLSSDDVAYFAPRMREWGLELKGIDLSLEGFVGDMRANLRALNHGENTTLSAKMAIKGLPNFRESHFNADIDLLQSSGSELEHLVSAVSGGKAPRELLDMGEQVELRGHLEGGIDDLTTDLALLSGVGNLTAKGRWQGLTTSEPTVKAEFSTKNLRLGKLLKQKSLGGLTMSGKIDGILAGSERSAQLSGRIERIMALGYNYQNISYRADIMPDTIDAKVVVADRNLDLELDVKLNDGQRIPQYDLDIDLRRADFMAMKINQRDSISLLSAKIAASLSGFKLEQMSGEVVITEGDYRQNSDTTQFDRVYLSSELLEGERTVDIESDFLDLSLRSKSSYAEVVAYLRSSLYQYLPSLYATPPAHIASSEPSQSDSHSTLVVEFKEASPLLGALSNGLQVAPGSKLNMMFNPTRNDISFSLISDYIERENMLALGINCNAINRGDSLAIYSSVGELYFSSFYASDFSLVSGIKGDRIDMRTNYLNPNNNSDAMIGAIAQLRRDKKLGRVLRLKILPSYVTSSEGRWDISSDLITIDSVGMSIDRFEILSGEQQLVLDGILSANPTDSLQLNLKSFDVAFLSDMVPALGYKIEGASDGRVVIHSAKRDARVMAHVTLDSLRVNSLTVPPVNISARWDAAREQARLAIINRERGDTLIRGNYRPKTNSYNARLEIDSLNMALLDPPLKGILTSTSGYANAELKLTGTGRMAKLEGGVDIHDLATTVGYTQVRYRMPSARLELEGNHLICNSAELLDSLGGTASMKMDIDLSRLTNIGYDVTVVPKNLMVFNTTEQDNPIFYGKLFASGGAEIKGSKQGVKMNIAATTDDNSEFYMPLGGKENISSASFITFVEPDLNKVDTASLIERKKLLFERKRRISSATGNLEVNMALDVKPNTEFQLVIDPTVGDIIRGRGEGKLNVTVNPKAGIFDIYGDYSITEGSYMFTLRNIISKKFVIEQGSSIQWIGDPLDAQLDISAIYKLKTSLDPLLGDESTHTTAVDCIIHLRDQLMRPTVEFDIDLPTADLEQSAAVSNLLNDQESISKQFFYLMIANSFMPENSAMSSFGASTAATTGFELLTNQLSNWLSATNYNVVIRYRPESESTNEEVDFGFSRGLVGNRLLIELEGNYVADGSQTMSENQNSNLSGEAYITWLIDNTGALKLKGFTQTIERYDENQGLQETGIGIYYRENFNNFKDLRERIIERFTSSKRREKRKAAKAERAAAKREDEDENETKQIINN